jgi:hypothetical protein
MKLSPTMLTRLQQAVELMESARQNGRRIKATTVAKRLKLNSKDLYNAQYAIRRRDPQHELIARYDAAMAANNGVNTQVTPSAPRSIVKPPQTNATALQTVLTHLQGVDRQSAKRILRAAYCMLINEE